MKKLFISQPINGLTDKEILKVREDIRKKAENEVGESLELIDNFFEDYPEEIATIIPVWYLGKSLQKLAEADIVYFGEGWMNARGCKIEHEVAVEYGIKIIEEKIMTNFEKYKDKISKIRLTNYNFGLHKDTNDLYPCNVLDCQKCKFNHTGRCDISRTKWLYDKYYEKDIILDDLKKEIKWT